MYIHALIVYTTNCIFNHYKADLFEKCHVLQHLALSPREQVEFHRNIFMLISYYIYMVHLVESELLGFFSQKSAIIEMHHIYTYIFHVSLRLHILLHRRAHTNTHARMLTPTSSIATDYYLCATTSHSRRACALQTHRHPPLPSLPAAVGVRRVDTLGVHAHSVFLPGILTTHAPVCLDTQCVFVSVCQCTRV